MDEKLIVISFIFGFLILTSYSQVVLREYHYVNLKMTWTNAQQYCRIKHTDLATIESMDDANRLNRPTSDDAPLWIGLNDDPKSWKDKLGADANSWKWSAGEASITGYEYRPPLMPDYYHGSEACVFTYPDGTWHDGPCVNKYYFACYQSSLPSGQKIYTSIRQAMSWNEAQAHCRANYTDLATIESDQEMAQLMEISPKQRVWIGLYRVPWMWSDRTGITFKNWASGEPDNYGGNEHCGCEDSNHIWHDVDCNQKLSFWCEEGLKMKMRVNVRMKFQTEADLSDPTINTQILQQLVAVLTSNGSLTDFKLGWKIQPEKGENY